jgi:ribosomal subunit interface protein
MHITVAGKQVETGDALKTHVRDGLAVIARKYFDHALDAHVTFRKDRAFFVCDINLHAARGLTMRGEGEGPDAHRAFEEAADHIAKRLRRYRRRVNEHARSLADGRALPEERPEPATRYVLREEEEPESLEVDGAALASVPAGISTGSLSDGKAAVAAAEGSDHGAIIAETPAPIERLTVNEAVMRMDLAHVQVLMFRNRSSGALNVVYRRQDGHVGWIDTAET